MLCVLATGATGTLDRAAVVSLQMFEALTKEEYRGLFKAIKSFS